MARFLVKYFVIFLVALLPLYLVCYYSVKYTDHEFFDVVILDVITTIGTTLLTANLALVAIYFGVLVFLLSPDDGTSASKKKLKRVTVALAQNAVWSIVFYIILLVLPIIKKSGIVGLDWTSIPGSFNRTTIFHSLIVYQVVIIGLGTIDIIAATVSLMKQRLSRPS